MMRHHIVYQASGCPSRCPSENLAKTTIDYLKNDYSIDFTKCRGQSYDNAANMSGEFKGMQAKIREENEYAMYIPCGGHSLNLVGRAAVDSCLEAVRFFSTVQEVYVFFSASPRRWAILNKMLKDNKKSQQLQRLSDTRWNAHAQSTSAIASNYDEIITALHKISNDEKETGQCRCEASGLAGKMEKLEFVFMLEFWNEILIEFDKTSRSLQNSSITISTTAKLYSSLAEFVQTFRDNFDDFESKAKEKLPEVDYECTTKRRKRRKKLVNDGDGPEATDSFSSRDKFRIQSFLQMIDALNKNLARRAEVYKDMSKMFSCFVNLDASKEEIKEGLMCIKEKFPKDIQDDFSSEVQHFHSYVKKNDVSQNVTHERLYQIIFEDKIQLVFPNVEAILRLFLSLMATNCSGERSFSKLKRIKNYSRTTMCQERLVALTLMFTESDKLRTLSFNDIIEKFAHAKCRKKCSL